MLATLKTTAKAISRAKLNTRLRTKLCSTNGDTMAESLVAILIAAMAAATLAIMIITSTNIVNKNSTTMDTIYRAESSINAASSSSATQSVATVEVNGDDLNANVFVYKDADEEFIRYAPNTDNP